MYLASSRRTAARTFQIRQSYRDRVTGWFNHRLIFDLGENPVDHLEVMGEIAVYFSSELEKAVRRHTDQEPGPLLEELLWNFLPRRTREHLSRFHRRDSYVPGPLSDEEQEKIAAQVHIFDRRRLYYLHYRAIDQSRLFTLRDRIFRPLLDQSRDEREYYFTDRERALYPGEYRNYLYAVFNLQRFFRQSHASFLPEALPREEVADRFVEALCELNANLSFWQRKPLPSWLHPHLARYLIMFFDYTPATRSYEQEFVRRFMDSHRTFRWPERKPAVSEERIFEIFGHSQAELRKLGKKELNRLYRKKAKQLHPDQGGDKERFVELTEVYNTLLAKR